MDLMRMKSTWVDPETLPCIYFLPIYKQIPYDTLLLTIFKAYYTLLDWYTFHIGSFSSNEISVIKRVD